MDPDTRLARLARTQHGVVNLRQALDAGLTRRQIDRRLASGRWRRCRTGVYVLNGVPTSYEQTVLAAVLSIAEPVWASHRTAAKLHGLWFEAPTAIDLVVTGGQRPRGRGIAGHRTGSLRPADVTRHHGIPVTTPARTLVDLSGGLDVRVFGRILDRAERDGLCRAEDVGRGAARLGEGAGRSLATVRAALGLRLPGFGPGDSDLEQQALTALASAGLPLPVRHHRVRVDGRTHEIDLAYPDERIAIELLGFAYHGDRSAFDDDSDRTRRLVRARWAVLPFTTMTPPAELAAEVGQLLEIRANSPDRAERRAAAGQ